MTQTKALTPVQKLEGIINAPSVQDKFKMALDKNADSFVASLIDIYSTDAYLQKCEPKGVVMEALKAATLKLPINKSLGFAYIVPYKGQAQFQLGYKGYIQLAQRTGQYKYINADAVYEGEKVHYNKVTGELEINGEPSSDKAIGYFAHIETVNGFRKSTWWSREKVVAHAERFSQSYKSSHSPWKTDFDAMAVKTVLKALLSKYGIMTVEMSQAISADEPTAEARAQDEISRNANQGDIIDVEMTPPAQDSEPEQQQEASPTSNAPDF